MCEIISLCDHILNKSCGIFNTSNDQEMGENQDNFAMIEMNKRWVIKCVKIGFESICFV